MATNRQTDYLRDLGVDARASLDDLPKEEASEWIEELKEIALRASLPVGRKATPELLVALGAREDALMLPPSRSMAYASSSSAPVKAKEASNEHPPVTRATVPADESWWKLELATTLPLRDGRSISVTVSGSEHRRRGLAVEDAESLAERVRAALNAEAARWGLSAAGAVGSRTGLPPGQP